MCWHVNFYGTWVLTTISRNQGIEIMQCCMCGETAEYAH